MSIRCMCIIAYLSIVLFRQEEYGREHTGTQCTDEHQYSQNGMGVILLCSLRYLINNTRIVSAYFDNSHMIRHIGYLSIRIASRLSGCAPLCACVCVIQ